MKFKIKDLMIDVLERKPKGKKPSAKAAAKLACGDCSNCTGCTRCSGCSDCSRCTLCSGCSNCTDCSKCTDTCHYGTPRTTHGHSDPREAISSYANLEKKLIQALAEARKRKAAYIRQVKKQKKGRR